VSVPSGLFRSDVSWRACGRGRCGARPSAAPGCSWHSSTPTTMTSSRANHACGARSVTVDGPLGQFGRIARPKATEATATAAARLAAGAGSRGFGSPRPTPRAPPGAASGFDGGAARRANAPERDEGMANLSPVRVGRRCRGSRARRGPIGRVRGARGRIARSGHRLPRKQYCRIVNMGKRPAIVN
jgi:hypothetical protein